MEYIYKVSDFRRDPHPIVLQRYRDFLKTGEYPYTQRVSDWIETQFSDTGIESIHHETYLAQCLIFRENAENLRNERIQQGWTPFESTEA